MKRLLLLFGSLCLLAGVAAAQQQEAQFPVPVGEVYGGYSYIRVAPSGQVNAFNANGGIGEFQYNLRKSLGLVAEFGGYGSGTITAFGQNFKGSQSVFTYLFGPRLTLKKTHKMSPFFEVLLGGAHESRSATLPNSLIPTSIVVPPGVTITGGSPNGKLTSHQNAFAMALGGGLEIKIKQSIAIRPIEVNWLPSHFSPLNFTPTAGVPATVAANTGAKWQQNFRYSGGISFRFGQK
jgi:opacity protein-like surface antigen